MLIIIRLSRIVSHSRRYRIQSLMKAFNEWFAFWLFKITVRLLLMTFLRCKSRKLNNHHVDVSYLTHTQNLPYQHWIHWWRNNYFRFYIELYDWYLPMQKSLGPWCRCVVVFSMLYVVAYGPKSKELIPQSLWYSSSYMAICIYNKSTDYFSNCFIVFQIKIWQLHFVLRCPYFNVVIHLSTL